MKTLFRLVLVCVALVLFAAGALFFLPQDRLGAIASSQLSRQLGRDVSLSSARLTLLPAPGLEVRQISVANADWAAPEPMVQADRALIRVDLAKAVTGTVAIHALEIDAPQIALEQTADGRANWELTVQDADTAGAQAAAPIDSPAPGDPLGALTLDRVSITGGQIRLTQAGAEAVNLRDVDLTVTWPEADGPATVQAAFTPYTSPIAIAATIDAPRIAMAGGVSEVSLLAKAAKGSAQFDGLLGLAPELSGRFDVTLPNTAAFLAALGINGVDLPKGAGQAIQGTGEVTLTAGQELALRQAVLRVDQNTMTVNADVALADKPNVTATITSPRLDFSDNGANGASSGSTSAASSWPKAPLDASALALLDGNISLDAGSIAFGGLELGATRTLLTIDNARAVFAIDSMEAYEGTVTGQFVANNRSGLSVAGKLAIADVAMKPLLTDTAGIGRLAGRATLSLDVLGAGQSVDAIMRSLRGSGVMTAGPGVISGIDLDRVFQDGQVSGGTTVFDTLDATFALDAGVMRNSDLAMALPRLSAGGEGAVDLGNQTIDYLITARDPKARGGRGLAIPVRIKGPWNAPTIRADAGELIDQNFAEERDALKQQVQDKVNDKLQEQLGVTVQDGESTEDALKKKLEEEVGKTLRGLFK